jgi:hypothetical protein
MPRNIDAVKSANSKRSENADAAPSAKRSHHSTRILATAAHREIRRGSLSCSSRGEPRPRPNGKRTWCFGKVLRVEKELKQGKLGTEIGFQRFEVFSQA